MRKMLIWNGGALIYTSSKKTGKLTGVRGSEVLSGGHWKCGEGNQTTDLNTAKLVNITSCIFHYTTIDYTSTKGITYGFTSEKD